MRTITGTTEEPGSGDNPKILAMADYIAKKFPDMADYCDQYQHDDTPWCGLTEAFCMAFAALRRPYDPEDAPGRFLWALAWSEDANLIHLARPRLGCIVVMERAGGGHVTTYEGDAGSSISCRGGNQSDAVNV